MFRFAVRALAVGVLFLIQLVFSVSPLYTFAILLLINRYVSPRESYMLAGGVGLLLDVFHWSVFGLPVSLSFLLLLALSEFILYRRRNTEAAWYELCVITMSAAALYILIGGIHRFWWSLGYALLAAILMGLWTTVLLYPIQQLGERYKKLRAFA